MKLKHVLLAFDLYWLRYQKKGEQWYELTDYVREKLKEDGVDIGYDDKNQDVKFSNLSIKSLMQKRKKEETNGTEKD